MAARKQRRQARFTFDEDVGTPPAQIGYGDPPPEPDASRYSSGTAPETRRQEAFTALGAWTWVRTMVSAWIDSRAEAPRRSAGKDRSNINSCKRSK